MAVGGGAPGIDEHDGSPGFQAAAEPSLHADAAAEAEADAARCQGRPARVARRRQQLVLGGLALVLAAVAVVQLGSGWGEGGPGASAALGARRLMRGGQLRPSVLQEADAETPSDDADEAPVAEFKSAAQRDAELQAEDEAFCQEFNGFLKEDCMEKRQKDRDAPKYWNAEQVRNGLWKTEKALADLEIRQYKHAKERDALHKEHQGRMAKFKKRMEVALDLIHTIQDEMGTRHSELVERLKGDIVSTQARLKKYLDDGLGHVNGKLSILEAREEALTARLLEMVQAQFEMLNAQAEAVHKQEMDKNADIHAFIAGVETAQRAGDLRIEEAINATRAKFERVRAREAAHYAELNAGADAQGAKQKADVAMAGQKIDTDVAALHANLSATLAADKAAIRSRLHGGWQEANQSMAQLRSDSEAAASAIDGRLRVQATAQAANNAEQDALMSALEGDLGVFNLTVFKEIVKVEGNASQFERALRAAEEQIRSEQQAQKADILAHINKAIEDVAAVHEADKAKMRADVAYVQPRTMKVAQELQDAIAGIEEQRRRDLAFLRGKLESNISAVNASFQAQHAAEKAKALAAVQALAARLGKQREDLDGKDVARTDALAKRMAAYTARVEANNTAQAARLAELRARFTSDAASRVQELVALGQRAEAVRVAMENARTKLLKEHAADMAAAKATLSSTLDALVTHITDLLDDEVTKTDGSIDGNLATAKRSLARLDSRIADQDARLNVSERRVRALVDEAFNKSETRILADDARVKNDRARWDAATARGINWHAWIDGNITAEVARLDDERSVILASVRWDLAAGLSAVTARVQQELGAMEGRQRGRIKSDTQHVAALLATLANLQSDLDQNATAQVQQLQARQAAREASHSKQVAALESGMGKDKAKVEAEVVEFNTTFQEAAARNARAQVTVRQGMEEDDARVRQSFAAALAGTRARLTRMIERSNVTELEDLEENVREVMMKVSKLGWRLGARGADLRALLQEVTAEQQRLFSVEGERLQQIKEAEVRAYAAHEQALSVLQSRVGSEEEALTAETFKLHQDLLEWDDTARDRVAPAVDAMETRLDASLRALGGSFEGKLQEKVAAQAGRAREQRSAEQKTLAQLASELHAARAVLDGHMPEQTALVNGAEATVNKTTAQTRAVLDAVEPVLSALQTRLATVYDSIRAQHDAATAKIRAEVDKGISDLRASGVGQVAREKLLLEALVAENMAVPEKALTMLQAQLNALDTRFRNALSAEKVEHGEQHDAVRVELGRLERELRESNTNLSSYVSGLEEDLDNWRNESTRALSKLERKQATDKSSFLASLDSTKRDVTAALTQLRSKFGKALSGLQAKIATAQSTLTAAHADLRATQTADKKAIRRGVREGARRLEASAESKLQAKGAVEKANVQAVIKAKTALVKELTQSTNALIDALRKRVKLAVQTEAADNAEQEQQLTTNDGKMQRWIRNTKAAEEGMQARLARLEERVTRRGARAEAEQNIMMAQLAAKLQRQVAAVNASVATASAQLVKQVQGSLGTRVARLEKKLGVVRQQTMTRLGNQRAALDRISTREKAQITSLQAQLVALRGRLAAVEAYSRGRTTMLGKRAEQAEADLRRRFAAMLQRRETITARIKQQTDAAYEQLQDDWTRRVNLQRSWLSRSLATQAADVERRLRVRSTRLSAQITELERRLASIAQGNDRKQGVLRARIAQATSQRGAVEELEAQVVASLNAAKGGVSAFTTDTEGLDARTKAQVQELERQIDANQGISTSTAELVRTLRALTRDMAALRAQEGQRVRSLRGRVREAKSQASATGTFLRNQVARLERMLSTDANQRRRDTATAAAKTGAYQLRMDRYRADLTRINATWNRMDEEASGAAAAAAAARGGGGFEAAPPAPASVRDASEKSVLNAWCARFRDHASPRADVLKKCYEQDCAQSLEGGDINRPDSPGCRFVDEHGFCYMRGAAQTWCLANARNPACHDSGARWAAAPLGVAASPSAARWAPKAQRKGGATLQCACMKNCRCTRSRCSCADADAAPVGDGRAGFAAALSRPVAVSRSKAGKCSCVCQAQEDGV